MSKIKSLIRENYDATEGHLDPFFYPGEEEAALEALAKESMLDNFTTQELQDEIWRRTFKPFNDSLEALKEKVENFGVDPERPF